MFNKSECVYTSCYCEENVWKLCDTVRQKSEDLLPQFKVVFISNLQKTVAFWSQKQGETTPDIPVVWDYHVFLIGQDEGRWQVFDLDTTLNFPEPIASYVEHSFRPKIKKLAMYKPIFRVVDVADFLNNFSSDRSHMKKADGSYMASPPEYPPIVTGEDSKSNLRFYISMKRHKKCYGTVYSNRQFLKNFSPESLKAKGDGAVESNSEMSSATADSSDNINVNNSTTSTTPSALPSTSVEEQVLDLAFEKIKGQRDPIINQTICLEIEQGMKDDDDAVSVKSDATAASDQVTGVIQDLSCKTNKEPDLVMEQDLNLEKEHQSASKVELEPVSEMDHEPTVAPDQETSSLLNLKMEQEPAVEMEQDHQETMEKQENSDKQKIENVVIEKISNTCIDEEQQNSVVNRQLNVVVESASGSVSGQDSNSVTEQEQSSATEQDSNSAESGEESDEGSDSEESAGSEAAQESSSGIGLSETNLKDELMGQGDNEEVQDHAQDYYPE